MLHLLMVDPLLLTLFFMRVVYSRRAVEGSKCLSPKEVEAKVIFCALKSANRMDMGRVVILSNAKEVIDALNGSKNWKVLILIRDIRNFINVFVNVTFCYVP